MKFIDEYRNPEKVKSLLREIEAITTHPWTLMEICGGQTHAFLHHGLDEMLPGEIELVHGPGCPVCVTPLEQIDKAIAIASRPEVIFTSYGDMLRVPGSSQDLFSVRAKGGDVRVVYSPLDAVQIAEVNPDKQVVFFAIGFETTAPANAMAVMQARQRGVHNFSVLISHVCVPPAMEAILGSKNNRVQAFLAAGHVCAVMGYHEYPQIAAKYKVPIVVTGFEPVDLLVGVLAAIKQLEAGKAEVENAYERTVSFNGNPSAQEMINTVFQPVDRKWRGIGSIPQSGLGLRPEFTEFDAEERFSVGEIVTQESPLCIAGEILQGMKKPPQCSAYGKECTPQSPLGAPMVSAEGACSAYYRYHRSEVTT
ncbi:MAG: hydrogenase formation protein HypD [Chloroflexi bacterium]|nr:hydrogenase formation protein HypD [Chloroflexota bacterium]MBI3170080.1 hydrogenase formation protein HypD [Chloroflexota bacterium]